LQSYSLVVPSQASEQTEVRKEGKVFSLFVAYESIIRQERAPRRMPCASCRSVTFECQRWEQEHLHY
jgi:hypothetical protein